jgi:hypothetical protein
MLYCGYEQRYYGSDLSLRYASAIIARSAVGPDWADPLETELQISLYVTQDLGAWDIIPLLCDLQQLSRGNSL